MATFLWNLFKGSIFQGQSLWNKPIPVGSWADLVCMLHASNHCGSLWSLPLVFCVFDWLWLDYILAAISTSTCKSNTGWFKVYNNLKWGKTNKEGSCTVSQKYKKGWPVSIGCLHNGCEVSTFHSRFLSENHKA